MGTEMNRRTEDVEMRGSLRGGVRASSPARFIRQHVAPLLYRLVQPSRPKNSRDRSFDCEKKFWSAAHRLALTTVELASFRLTDWFPRSPGVYWSDSGVLARRDANQG